MLIVKSIVNKLKTPGSALRQMSFVVGGTCIAQVLNVLILPVISRIYTPADFGVLAVYTSVIAVLSEVSGFRYHNAIPLPKNKRYSQALVTLSAGIQCIIVTFILLILLLWGDNILNVVSIGILSQYKLFIPVGVTAIGVYNILVKMSIRNSCFAAIAKTKISQALGRNITFFILGITIHGPVGLIIGTIIGQSGGIITLLKNLLPLKNLFCTEPAIIYRVALRYRHFPLYNMCFGVVNTFGLYLPQLALSAYYGPSVTGIYAMATLLLSLPSRFIGEAIGSVFVQRASTASHTGNLQNLSMRFYIVMLKISIFPVAVLSLSAPLLLGIILGTQWAESGVYALALVPFTGFSLVYSPLNVSYLICERQKEALWHEILSVVCKITIFCCGGLYNITPIYIIFLFSLVSSVVSFLRVIYLLGIVGISKYCVVISTFKTLSFAACLLLLPGLCYVYSFNKLCLLSITILLIPYLYKTMKDMQSLSVL